MVSNNISILTQIFSILGLPSPADVRLLNGIAQKNFLRKPDQELWEMEYRFEDQREQLLPLLSQLNFCTEIQPPPGHYIYALILGSLSNEVQRFIEHLVQISHTQKITYDCVVLLGSSRPLHADFENITLGNTEAEMMETLYKQSQLAHHPYRLIDAPLKITGHGCSRPTTDDTLFAWLATNPQPGSCLVISEQPFIQRQLKVLQTVLPREFTFAAAGLAAEPHLPMVVYLDALARTIYQELICIEEKSL